MNDPHKVKIGQVSESVVNAINNTIPDVMEANADIRAFATNIEKRGFTYTGDNSNNWGLRGGNINGGTGFQGVAPFFGRGLELTSFSLQPFGIGTNGILTGGITPSIYAGTGAGIRFSKTTHVSHMKMAVCVEAYKGFGIIKNIIDLMANFASEGLTVVHPSASIQKFYQRWVEAVGLRARCRDIFRYYYKYGNVFIYTTMGKIDDETYRKMKTSTKAGKDADVLDHNDPRGKKRKPKGKEIPWRYTLLNPFQMDLRGTKYFGGTEWVFIPDEEMKSSINTLKKHDTTDVLDESEVNVPPEFQKLRQEDNVIALDQDKLWVLHYMKDDHEDWADPMVWPVMNDVMYKQQLRAMDMSVCNSVINAITIIKLGNIDKGFVAPKEHYRKISEMLRTPTYSHNIVWNDAISMESNYPPIEKLLSIDKYTSVDRDILAGLGIPGILVSGSEGGSFSNAFLQVKTLVERLEEARETVIEWINSQLRIIAQVMGHREIPTIKFGQMSLRDEQAEKNLVMQLYDRDAISVERLHEAFDVETDVEVERMKREKAIRENDEIFMRFGPFKDPMNMMTTEEQMDKEHENELETVKLQNKNKPKPPGAKKPGGSAVKKKNGRPSGTKGIPQKKKRNTKPKGSSLGSIIETDYDIVRLSLAKVYDSIDEHLTSMMLNARGLQYKKQLSREDKQGLEDLVFGVFANATFDDNITADYVRYALENLTNIDESVVEEYNYISETIGTTDIESRREARIIAKARSLYEEESGED